MASGGGNTAQQDLNQHYVTNTDWRKVGQRSSLDSLSLNALLLFNTTHIVIQTLDNSSAYCFLSKQ